MSGTPLLAQSPDDAALEEGLVRVRIDRIYERDLLVRLAGDTLFLPVVRFCDELRIPVERLDDGRVAIEPEHGSRIVIESDPLRIEGSGETAAGDLGGVRVVDDELFVRYDLLARLLDLPFDYNQRWLTLTLPSDIRIPLVRLAKDQERYRLLASSPLESPAGLEYEVPYDPPLIGSGTLFWSLSGSDIDGSRSGRASLGLSAPFLFGHLVVRGSGRWQQSGDRQLSASLDAWRYEKVFPTSTMLSEVALSSSLRGGRPTSWTLSASNRRFGEVDVEHEILDGSAEPGSTVELYRNGDLVAVTRADSSGEYLFEVPRFGPEEWTIARVDRHAQRHFETRYVVRTRDLLPSGRVNYSLRATTDRFDGAARPSGRLRAAAGITSWLTLGADATYRTPLGSEGEIVPLSERVTPGLAAHLRPWSGAVVGLRYNPIDRAVGAELTTRLPLGVRMSASIDSLLPTDGSFRTSTRLSGDLPGIGWRVAGALRKDRVARTWEVRPAISTSLLGASLLFDVRYRNLYTPASGESNERSVSSTEGGVTAIMQPFGLFSLSGNVRYDFDNQRIQRMTLRTGVRLARWLTLRAGWSGTLAEPRGNLFAQLGIRLGMLDVRTGGTWTDDGIGYYAMPSVRGGARISAAGFEPISDPRIDGSAIVVRAWHDADGNGRRDDGEEWIASPGFRVVAPRTSYDAVGTLPSISPYLPCRVEIDRASHAGTGLFPMRSSYLLRTAPGGVQVLDVPYSRGFYVTGRIVVELENGRQVTPGGVLGGIDLELTSADGRMQTKGEVFGDGTILIEGVLPGRYHISFDTDQLERRGIRPGEMPTEIEVRGDQELPMLKMVPAEG